MDANALKKAAAEAALAYVEDDAVVGVGTGSTVNFFIDALASRRARIKTTVASSEASAARLRSLHIPVSELNDVDGCDVRLHGHEDDAIPPDGAAEFRHADATAVTPARPWRC